MGLKIPELDDRDFASILEEARQGIPVHSETWTDHNVHDPGITILEALSWLTESYNYQLDQVTDAHRRKYLKLLGVTPEPPRPAAASLRLRHPEGTKGTTVPEGQPLVADDASGEQKHFQTVAPVTLTTAELVRVISETESGRIDNTMANDTPDVHFLGFGATARVGSAMYLGFDTDPFDGVGTLDIAMNFHDEGLPDPASHGTESSTFGPTVVVSWQYCREYTGWYLDPNWHDFDVPYDGTNRLYQDGTVHLARPSDWNREKASPEHGVLGQDEGFVWIRCLIEKPSEEDPSYDGAPHHEVPPQFESIDVNTVQAIHKSTVTEEVLTRPDGGTETTAGPSQTFGFEHGPVLEDRSTPDIVVRRDPQGILDEQWTRVEDFDGSASDDYHYVLDVTAGTIRFGDEIRGAIPDVGREVVAKSYVHGGGTEGNVPESTSWQFRPEIVVRDGVYKFYSGADTSLKRRGAIVVGDPPEGGDASEFDYGDWFADVPGEVTTDDRRGDLEVEITVGADGGSETDVKGVFSPMAVRIDPGTVVRFVWQSGIDDIVVHDQPTGSEWVGYPSPPFETITDEDAFDYEQTYTFESSVDLSDVLVHPNGPASGGRDAESLDAAFARLRADLREAYRAVTAVDYGTVATNTPGLRFGRAKAVLYSGTTAEGCNRRPNVRVIVVPFSTRDKPVPTNGFLEAVDCHLQEHRLLTERVTVEPPAYVGISVTAEIRIAGGYSGPERTVAVENRLAEFLHPLEGFDGNGWPFGRPVYQSELYEVIAEVEGVDCVLDVAITASGATARYHGGNVEIGQSSLVFSEDHSVVVESDRGHCGVET
ncbi:baseplate J/gp47 family protein [Haladaptatus sp. DFWS20]|uniref:baseplate J/gp47 family protein n=1 Tax=Haladaptatus sp. DFWS20 TaxID=3403467 RepID=UPI003EB76070